MALGLKLKPLLVDDLTGGLQEGIAPHKLQTSQQQKLVNLRPFGGRLTFRNGVKRYSEVEYSLVAGTSLSTIYPFKDETDTIQIVVGAPRAVTHYNTTTGVLEDATVTDGKTYASVPDPWVFKTYNGTLYACRKGTGTIKAGAHDTIRDAGFTAPAVGSFAGASGVAGNLVPGDYKYVVTFGSIEADAESDPSDPITVTVASSSKVVDLSGIPIGTNPRVNRRSIYRSLVDSTGEYFWVADILDNTTTTYQDNVAPANLGRRASFSYGVPPANVNWMEIFNERMFATDGSAVYYSQAEKVEGFDATDELAVYKDDGADIVVLHAFGDRLIIGKTNATHYLTGSDKESFHLGTLSDEHGVVAPASMVSGENQLFWLSGDRNVYHSNGTSVNSISTLAMRKTLDAVTDAQLPYITATLFPTLSLYVMSLPSNKVLVYNYKDDRWTTFEHSAPAVAPCAFGTVYQGDDARAEQVFAVFTDSGHLYEYLERDTWKDDGTAYEWLFKTGVLPIATGGFQATLHKLMVECTQVPVNMTITAYKNYETSAWKTRTGSLYAPGWKTYSFYTDGTSDVIELELKASPISAFDFNSYSLDYASFARVGRAT